MNMREEDNIERLFKRLEGSFDVETPTEGHQIRFLDKLNAQNTKKGLDDAAIVFEHDPAFKPQKFKWNWIAAACVLFLTLGIFLGSLTFNTDTNDLANVSPDCGSKVGVIGSLPHVLDDDTGEREVVPL